MRGPSADRRRSKALPGRALAWALARAARRWSSFIFVDRSLFPLSPLKFLFRCCNKGGGSIRARNEASGAALACALLWLSLCVRLREEMSIDVCEIAKTRTRCFCLASSSAAAAASRRSLSLSLNSSRPSLPPAAFVRLFIIAIIIA
jgi:hypothetical protein